MKKLKAFINNAGITMAFYVALLIMPALVFSGSDYSEHLAAQLNTHLPNYIFYVFPVLLTIFAKKKMSQQDSAMSQIFIYSLAAIAVATEYHSAPMTYFYTIISILVLSVVCMNINNNIVQALILVPGLFISRLGIGYLFVAYIPVLLMMFMQVTAVSEEEKAEKKTLWLIFGGYLYAAVFALILIIRHRLAFDPQPVNLNLSSVNHIIIFAAGLLLVLTACVLFIIRALPLIRNGSALQKISICLFAVYPLIYTATALTKTVISSQPVTVFMTALLIYVSGNINLSGIYKDNAGPVMPQKYRNIIFGFAAAALCILVF